MRKFILIITSYLIICFGYIQAQEVTLDEDFSSIPGWHLGAGIWKIQKQMLFQNNAMENMALASMAVKQSGYLVYSFELTITEGLDDGYGGVGIHILSDTPTKGRSWGQGKSVLLWLTYDVNAYGGKNFFGQIYHSTNETTMSMIHEGNRYPLPIGGSPETSPLSITGKKLFIRIAIDTATGIGILYDPFQEEKMYQFDIQKKNMTGNYITFRTNSLGVTLDNVKVINLPV